MSGPERREQIVEAAYAVVLEKGLADAATRDVTRRIGVGSGLLHHYFKTWKALRAEVVRVFIAKEIAELEATLVSTPPDALIVRVVAWMVQDTEYRHWRLWLDAIEEARRDPELAVVVEAGYARWHATLRQVIQRTTDAELGICPDPDAAAWRASALIDGLVGMLASGRTALTAARVEQMLLAQFAMELQQPSPQRDQSLLK